MQIIEITHPRHGWHYSTRVTVQYGSIQHVVDITGYTTRRRAAAQAASALAIA